MALEFSTDTLDDTHELHNVEFTLDGEKYTAYPPSKYFFERLASVMVSGSNFERMHWSLRMLDEALGDAQRAIIESRLRDPSDKLNSVSQLVPYLMQILNEWNVDTEEWETTEIAASPSNRAQRRSKTVSKRKPGRPRKDA